MVILMHNKETITLRKACEDDAKMLWEWANDPEVRAASFSLAPITWEEHAHWLKSRLNDSSCIFYIGMNNDNVPIGQIRYDTNNDEATVSVSIGKESRAKGYGNILIRLASEKLFAISNARRIHAYIKPTNRTSVCAFLRAHFKEIGLTTVHGHEAVHFVLVRKNET